MSQRSDCLKLAVQIAAPGEQDAVTVKRARAFHDFLNEVETRITFRISGAPSTEVLFSTDTLVVTS